MKKPTPEILPTLPLQSPASSHRPKASRPPSRFAPTAGWTMWCLATMLIGVALPVYAEDASEGNTSAKSGAAEVQLDDSTMEASSADSIDSEPSQAEPSQTEPTELEPKPPVGRSIQVEATHTGSGLWIFIDPETGQQVAQPTHEQKVRLRKFATPLNKSDQA